MVGQIVARWQVVSRFTSRGGSLESRPVVKALEKKKEKGEEERLEGSRVLINFRRFTSVLRFAVACFDLLLSSIHLRSVLLARFGLP
jgi:hypothetical protein